MGCSLLLGVLFAVGHHQFYHFLNERIVGSDDQQQWFLRIGAGFAFVVKTTLTAAVELAYTQILWRILSSRPISIKGIDSFFSVVNDAWHFRNGEIYRKGPALALVAVIMWYVLKRFSLSRYMHSISVFCGNINRNPNISIFGKVDMNFIQIG
jgi:hypothetical protein